MGSVPFPSQQATIARSPLLFTAFLFSTVCPKPLPQLILQMLPLLQFLHQARSNGR